MGAEFVGTPAFAQIVAAQEAGERSLEQVAIMPAVVVIARVTMHFVGEVVNFAHDKAKNDWKEDELDFGQLLETYDFNRSVSLVIAPAEPQGKLTTKDTIPLELGIGEAERLSKSHEHTITYLIARDELQGRMITAHERRRLNQTDQTTDRQQEPQQDQTTTQPTIVLPEDIALQEAVQNEDVWHSGADCPWTAGRANEANALQVEKQDTDATKVVKTCKTYARRSSCRKCIYQRYKFNKQRDLPD